VAWRALEAPHTEEVLLARGDLGAIRNFLQPRGDHRWARPSATVRLRPVTPAAEYDLLIDMGAPPPAPADGIDVELSVDGAAVHRLHAGPVFAEHRLRVPAPRDGVIEVRLQSGSWSRTGQPAAQGVAVRRVSLAPAAANARSAVDGPPPPAIVSPAS
jgi:hypothetical protein